MVARVRRKSRKAGSRETSLQPSVYNFHIVTDLKTFAVFVFPAKHHTFAFGRICYIVVVA